MNENFKTKLAAFMRDMADICTKSTCRDGYCPLMLDGVCMNNLQSLREEPNFIHAAVEAYRRRKKPCAEVIDEALDVYTIEVEIVRGKASAQNWTPQQGASYTADYIKSAYQGDCATVRVLSAKRFVLESRREKEE